jgi:hypothetical protein
MKLDFVHEENPCENFLSELVLTSDIRMTLIEPLLRLDEEKPQWENNL